MKIFDTAQKSYVEFRPGPVVQMYVCGITPYDSAHLGHIFTFMTYDLLQRRLEDLGHEVRMVRNITDVDEPIYVKARELGIDYRALATAETASFQATLQALYFRKPYAEPRASDYILQMAQAVEQLVQNGFGYRLEQDIYFDTAKFSAYLRFSGFNERLIMGLSRMRGGDPDRLGKRHPLDFMLWKGITDPDDLAQWKTSLGSGRPGWHIECSVMSTELLTVPFDIHGGGTDLIFPHHSSEIAQNYGLGKPVTAKHWLHVSPLLFEGEKMSKSLGNLVFAHDLLGHYDPAVIRLALMHDHHRQGGEWLPELLEESAQLLHRAQQACRFATPEAAETLLKEVRAALDDDLDTPRVIALLKRFICAKGQTGSGEDTRAVVKKSLLLLGLMD